MSSDKRANPMHFDDTDMVKLMDVDAKEVYPQTDIYRRSVLMIKIDDQTSYGVDFFRIKGGDKHEYSLHTTSDEVFEISGLGNVEKQTDENGMITFEDLHYGSYKIVETERNHFFVFNALNRLESVFVITVIDN